MSHQNESRGKISIPNILARKESGEKISMVTCYDGAFARLVDASNIDMVLVGDSLGNVILGFEDTIPVTVDHMIHHCSAVARKLSRPLLAVDMPYMSYKKSVDQALTNASRLIQEGGAQAVKVEGGETIAAQVEALAKADIPVIGHLGLTPQSIHTIGGYKVQGREEKAQQKLIQDAKILESAGAFCLVMELVPATLAKTVTEKLTIPTIGIGAGSDCDGQVLVLHDLLGFDQSFKPKFLKHYADMSAVVSEALASYDREVKEKVFPGNDHSF